MAKRFEFLDDVATADAAFMAYGDSLDEVFLAATEALIETLADPGTVMPTDSEVFSIRQDTLDDLLVDWLNALVFLKDARGMVFSRASLIVQPDPTGQGWRVDGRVRGQAVDPQRQALRGDVKAVTKHWFSLSQVGEEWVARVVLDL
ncbi:MAG: archease [Nitrospirales bacterium]